MNMTDILLKIKDLHASVGDKEILKGIDLEIRRGEIHAVMGPNGAGKSTLSSVLTGKPNYEVTAGSIKFDGKDLLAMKPEFAKREVNVGFSGGEKKRNEIFQMAMLDPTLAILDETDSGLDVDALKIVADGVNALHTPEKSAIVITHYQKLLEYVRPDVVHVLKDGRIVATGGYELIDKIEKDGFEQF